MFLTAMPQSANRGAGLMTLRQYHWVKLLYSVMHVPYTLVNPGIHIQCILANPIVIIVLVISYRY